MAFGFYQSLRSVPKELVEATRNLHFSPWMRFWKLEVPFAVPQLTWNMMISMAGGWFFVVASESISVGETQISLPGIGSYIAVAIAHKDMEAIAWAIITMVIVLLLTDQLFFRPLLCWSQRFVADQDPDKPPPRSWMLTMLRRSVLIATLIRPLATLWKKSYRPQSTPGQLSRRLDKGRPNTWQHRMDQLWLLFLLIICMLALWSVGHYVTRNLPTHELGLVALRGLATMARVFAMLALATLIWVPVGVWIGTNLRLATALQPIVQLVSAFPANLLFPVVASIIVSLHLNPEVWLSPLLILGAQWYILFNVIAGAMAIPRELKDVSRNLQLKGWLWWRTLGLPAIAPFYITGAITAAGGAWNASIVAEVVSWGRDRLMAHGLGSYITMATMHGDFNRLVLGIATMSFFVVLVNQLLWRPLYRYAERRFQFN
jgi:NitT/TauT family transport system permease protein